jgi:dynein heavy chain
MTAECYYGGRVTDGQDRILIITLLADYYDPDVVQDKNYQFSPDPIYKLPEVYTFDEFIEYVKNLPMETHPEVFGFNANADITKNLNETNLLLDSLIICNDAGGSGEGGGTENILKKVI